MISRTALNNPRHQGTPQGIAFYREALAVLSRAEIPFLVGGGYAIHVHTGIARATKDFDLFVLPQDVERIRNVLSSSGFQTELVFPHWLAKARSNGELIDIIFSSGNGLCAVDRKWFEHAVDGVVLDLPVKVCPPEETIWQKAFIMERDRYDGADIAHLLKACGPGLDWPRLLERFADHWRVLFAHLVLFGYVYPGETGSIPGWVLRELAARSEGEIAGSNGSAGAAARLCRGTLFSRQEYQVDIEHRGYRDARLVPLGRMTRTEVALWNDGADPPPP